MISRLKTPPAEAKAEKTEGEVKEEEVIIMKKKYTHINTQDNHNRLNNHRINEEEGENG